MKRLAAILVFFLMVAAFSGCGGENASSEETADSRGNEISQLFEEGYQCTMYSASENQWAGIFQKDDSYDVVYKVVAAISSEQYEELSADSYEDEESEARQHTLLGSLEDVTVTDVTDRIPSQEVLDAYVGKTLGDLENDGFENSGYSFDEGVCTFLFDGPEYTCNVTLPEGTVIEDMDDYSPNDLRALTIGGMEFSGFSFGFLD